MPDTHSVAPFHPRPGPFAALLGWVLGTALQLQQGALWPLAAYLPLLLLAGVASGALWRLRLARWRLWHRGLAWLLVAGAMGFACTGLRSLAFASQALVPALEGRDLRVVGVVADMPQRNETGVRFTLDVDSATLDAQAVVLPPRIDVAWYSSAVLGGDLVGLQGPASEVRAGERWSLTLRPKAPHGGRNPFGFDYELSLWERDVQATAYVRATAKDEPPQRLAQTGLHPVAWLRQSVRERIVSTIPERQVAGLVAALVVGDQAAIDRADWDVFRATGVAHLVSISGLHITMFAWGATWLLARLWRRSGRLCLWLAAPTAALAGGVLTACAYSAFSGWGIPAQRTCLMLLAVALLRMSGARWPWPQTWMLACALVVASDPWALLQAGFWLSFVAVGVLFATDAHTGASPPQSAGAWRGLAGRLTALLREQWVVTLALAPLTLLLFGQVSVVGLLANALAIPWVTLVVTPLAMLGVLLPVVWQVASLAIALQMGVLEQLAAWPWATFSLATAPWALAAVGVLGGVLLVARLPWSMRALGLPLLLPCLLWQAPLPPEGSFELLAADIGQGNAVLVRTRGHALLYDAGPRYSVESDAGHRVLLPLLQALHTRLDMLLISHRDSDHVGGAVAVLGMQPQAALLSSIAAEDHVPGLRPAQPCLAGQHWVWDGVQFDILHPQAADYGRAHTPNAVSCVLRIQSADVPARVALLVGDIEQPQEAQLLAASAASQASLKADLLLVPHHGSKTSSSEAFLDAVQPQTAWVQAGYRNRYGHPAPAVMQRYRQRGIVVHDSPHCGAMVWRSDLADQTLCERTVRMHYWSHRMP